MQFDAGPAQLRDGLDEVARVGPEAGVIQGDDQVPGFAGESGQPLDLFPARREVFAGMRVRPGQDDGVPAPEAHHFAQGVHSFAIKIVHKSVDIWQTQIYEIFMLNV